MTVKEAILSLKKLIAVYEKQIRFQEDLLQKAEKLENFEQAALIFKELNAYQEALAEAFEMLEMYQNISDN